MLRRCNSRTILTATSLILGTTDDGSKAGHTAVHQLDTPRAQLNVVNGTIQMTIVPFQLACSVASGLVNEVPPASLNPGMGSG